MNKIGNHDHQFTALIEALPEPQGGFTKYSETEFASDDEVDPEFVKDMLHIHPKGRRYAAKMQRLCGKNGGYDVYMTAVSYGCTSGKRNELLPLVPQSHIDFLKNLSYVFSFPPFVKFFCFSHFRSLLFLFFILSFINYKKSAYIFDLYCIFPFSFLSS